MVQGLVGLGAEAFSKHGNFLSGHPYNNAELKAAMVMVPNLERLAGF